MAMKSNPIPRCEAPPCRWKHQDMLAVSAKAFLPVAGLKSWQETISERECRFWSDILVALWRGQYVVMDGNHRVAEALEAGDKVIECRLVLLEDDGALKPFRQQVISEVTGVTSKVSA